MDAEQLRAIGLERDPFADGSAGDFFFATAAIAQRLDLLHHLVQFSDLLLVVAAPEGAGKSSLLEQVAAGAGESWRICSVDASRCFDARALTDQLVAGLGVDTEEDDAGERSMLVRARLEAIARDGGLALILVDDAELMSGEALAETVALAARSEQLKARFLLACDTGHAAAVADAAARVDASELVYSVEVPTLSAEQTGDYIHTRLHTAGLVGDSPFTGAVIGSIYNASGGLPGRVNAVAVQVIENHAARRRLQAGASRRLTLRDLLVWSKWLSAASVALVLLIVVVLVLPPSSPEVPIPVPTRGGPGNDAGDAATDPAVGAGAPEPDAPPPTEEEPVSVIAPVEEEPAEPASPPPDASPEPSPAREEPVAAADAVPAPEPSPAALPPDPDPAPAETPSPAAAVLPPVPPPGGKPSPPATARPSPAAPPAAPAGYGGIRDLAWLKAQVPAHYTIQLVGTHSEAAMRQFVREHRLGPRAAWYRASHRGRPWYVVVYGLYPTRAAARAALEDLPGPLRKVNPWTRSISSILQSTDPGR